MHRFDSRGHCAAFRRVRRLSRRLLSRDNARCRIIRALGRQFPDRDNQTRQRKYSLQGRKRDKGTDILSRRQGRIHCISAAHGVARPKGHTLRARQDAV